MAKKASKMNPAHRNGLLLLIATVSLGCPASAQDQASPVQTAPSLAATIAAMPKNLPRAPGPSLAEALAAAQAAQQACAARNVPVSVLIADSVGAPVVLLSGDGAGVRSQLIARTKARIVARYAMASGEVERQSKSNPQLIAEAAADPEIGVLRGGGFPVLRDGKILAIVAVSGGSLSGVQGLDEACAQTAVTRLQRR
ncbi:hypothetical protein CP98_00952 [Sphingobium yanoikuyae]|jgi:uncharacterized protein GlcG (DUF336 family)|uniref:Heme-binding protein n=1 Tax=Sphingobium yanoikuyae TaxID=13690 RepID=A0A084ESG9_SPHYA|nr:heme-binding protein [Sphingobium yanoikuyae]KEZ20911.1 hypothetical protein CP98_00952 [Sphingobium yanoikuyae]